MNKFIKLPLFLGSVCLVFCATLSVVVNICQPVIDYNNRMKQLNSYTKSKLVKHMIELILLH